MAELLGICADDIKLSQLEEFPGTVCGISVTVVSFSTSTHSDIMYL